MMMSQIHSYKSWTINQIVTVKKPNSCAAVCVSYRNTCVAMTGNRQQNSVDSHALTSITTFFFLRATAHLCNVLYLCFSVNPHIVCGLVLGAVLWLYMPSGSTGCLFSLSCPPSLPPSQFLCLSLLLGNLPGPRAATSPHWGLPQTTDSDSALCFFHLPFSIKKHCQSNWGCGPCLWNPVVHSDHHSFLWVFPFQKTKQHYPLPKTSKKDIQQMVSWTLDFLFGTIFQQRPDVAQRQSVGFYSMQSKSKT